MKRTTTTKKNVFQRFNNIREFNNYLNTHNTQEGWYYLSSQDTGNDALDFTGTATFEEADGLLLGGDKALQKKIEDAGVKKTRVQVQRQAIKRQPFAAVVGAVPHVPNAVAGVPTSMIITRQTKVKSRVLNVFYNMAVSGDTPSRNIIHACSNFISACMLIEASGVRLNIYACSASTGRSCRGKKFGFSIKIKDSGQPFDTLRMSYPLAHSSMNRRHKFRFLEVTEGVPTSLVGNYGYRISDKEARELFEENGYRVDSVLSYNTISGLSAEIIAKMITSAK